LLEEVCAQHGPVRHIVCPTYAVEHKVYVGALAREFPDAELWVAPGLWSYPINLPIRSVRFPYYYSSTRLGQLGIFVLLRGSAPTVL
jgi:hypothetical protein